MSIPGVSRHARDRMQERHGRDLTRTEWLAVVLQIIDRKALLVRRDTAGGGELYDVIVGAITLRVAWNPISAVVSTVLADHSSTSRKAAKVRSRGIRNTFRKGRAYYDKDGNRI